MSPPRLPTSLEHRILRGACALPAGMQRALFGRPPGIDGQVLAAEMQALLKIARLGGDDSASAGGVLSPKQARKRIRAGAAAAAGPQRSQVTATDLAIPGPAGSIAARFYEPPGLGLEQRPLVLYFHGGGWTIGDLDTCASVCRFLAGAVPATVLAVDYRLAPEHPFPAALEDAHAAFLWTAGAGSKRLGADPARIAVAGDSAGGNLAAALSIAARDAGDPAPALQALVYPVTDAVGDHASRDEFAEGFLLTRADMDWFERHYLPPDADRADPRVSVLRAPDLSGLPPAYVTTAGFDPLRDEGEAFAERLREAGVEVTLKRHPDLIHGFVNMTAVSPRAEAATRDLADAIRVGLEI